MWDIVVNKVGSIMRKGTSNGRRARKDHLRDCEALNVISELTISQSTPHVAMASGDNGSLRPARRTVAFEVPEPSESVEHVDKGGNWRLVSHNDEDLGNITMVRQIAFSSKSGSGRVMRALLEPGSQPVVLKQLSLQVDAKAKATGNEKRIWVEASENPYILAFLGLCVDPATRNTFLVSPYMKNGDLAVCLSKRFACSPDDIKRYLDQVLNGLMFLHEEKDIVHGDLKAENILITDNLDAVIADFGLSRHATRIAGESTTEPQVRTLATSRYTSVEHHAGKLCHHWGAELCIKFRVESEQLEDEDEPLSKTAENDMWAVRCLISHMYTRDVPWGSQFPPEQIHSATLRGQRPLLQLGRGGAQDRGLDFDLWNTAQACWAQIPSHRPQAADIIRWRLEGSPRLSAAISSKDTILPSMIEDRVVGLVDEVYSAWPDCFQGAKPPYIDPDAFVPFAGYVQRPAYWIPAQILPPQALVVLVTRQDPDCAVDDDGWSQELLREMITWSRVRHENLLPLIGRCKVDGVWHAVSPYWTSVRCFKAHEEREERTTRMYRVSRNVPFLRILRDIASALQFLHSQRPPLVHGAVHIDNIVLGGRDRFGATPDKPIDACLGNYSTLHSLGYGEGEHHPEVKKDVYDFGVLMRELLDGRFSLTGATPVSDERHGPKQSSSLSDLYDLCTTDVEESRANMEAVAITLAEAVILEAQDRLC
ncbi:kinase-like protein [Exidia glandulosa HHB12029]|uniref:Kinase-like protein n=1 Tax=Exidia glandulosa HHB12029 TaxID=1314781 RepID=A0A165CIV9_EXIGL|nr:kinase-like protein [Exidia glandulosa HHB12029]